MKPSELYELSPGDRDATMLDTDIANAVIRGVKRIDNISFSPDGSGEAIVSPDNIVLKLNPVGVKVQTTGDLNGEPASCILMGYEQPQQLPDDDGGGDDGGGG